jgi:N-methylhydantoinase B
MTPDRGVDPITLEVTRHALESIVEEMIYTILRNSQSSVVKLSMDFSTALCGPDGTLLVQGLSSALHLGAVPDMMRAVLRAFGDQIRPGDVYLTNDPYDGGMHIPDLFAVSPIHAEGRLLGFSVSVCHHVDMGGRVPGSIAADSTEIYQEGLRLPPLRLVHAGRRDPGIFAVIAANTRLPETVLADLEAQLAAAAAAERGVLDLAGRMGLDDYLGYAVELVDYSERLTRAAIAGWTDGTYAFTDWIDHDGLTASPLPISVQLEVAGDGLVVGFEGTAGQTRGAINATLSSTKAAVYAAVRFFLPAEVPNNEGFFRAIELRTRPGTLVHVAPPGACAARGNTMFRTFDAIIGALSIAHPDRAFAASDGGSTGVSIGGFRADGSRFVLVDFFAASWGARSDKDGVDGTATPAGNAVNEPVELLEAEYPIRIEEYGFVPDTGGPGRYRGGLAIRRSYRLLEGEAVLTVRSDRTEHPPPGLVGGHAGSPSETILHTSDGAQEMPAKFTVPFRAGEWFQHTMPGAGGYGDPATRDPALVADDLRTGKITPSSADGAYAPSADHPE